MKRLVAVIFLVLNSGVAFGVREDFSEYIQITKANAKQHGISFFYHAPVPALVSIEMPFTKGEQIFDEAVLEFSTSQQHFKIPIQGKKHEGEKLFIAFWMDSRTLRESSLKIRFSKRVDINPTVYVLVLKDFVPNGDVSPSK